MKGLSYVMKSFELAGTIIESAISEKKYNVISECSKIINPDKCDIICEAYNGEGVRVFKHNGNVNILIPEKVSVCESEYLTNAIKTGSIFDEAETVDNASQYVIKTALPIDSMINQGVNPPTEALMPAVGSVIGRVGEDGLEIDEVDVQNGNAMVRDLVTMGENGGSDVKDIVNNYLSIKDRGDTPETFKNDAYEMKNALEELNKYDDDEPLPDEDCIDCEIECNEACDDADTDYKQEAFLSKAPKRLKPIEARSIIAYVTTEMNAIRDTNDQAMLSAYVCSKLETADFYLSCIDNNDGKYIVPHDRTFLVNYINQLNGLLTKILQIKPVNKQDRVWKIDVKYPAGWEG